MSYDKELEETRRHAHLFLEAIENTDMQTEETNMRRFPHDCCTHACSLLARYLQDAGLGPFDTIMGQHPRGQGHGKHRWLQKGDLIVDITAYQFSEIQDKVLVTRSSAWHDGLAGVPIKEDPQEVWEEFYKNLYPRILANVKAA